MAKSKMEEARERFVECANKLKAGEKLTVFVKHGEMSCTLCNNHGEVLTRASGCGYDKEGACMDVIASDINNGKHFKIPFSSYHGPDVQMVGDFVFRKILEYSRKMKIPVSVYQISKID